MEFRFSPLQRDEPGTGSEWDALGDENTVVPELGVGMQLKRETQEALIP